MKTSIGELDGDGWEEYCQKLLKTKYYSDGYHKVPARFGGDLGIEGYTSSGLVFQCYSPDGNPSAKELYKSQRNKITRDIKTLLKNGPELLKIMGGVVIEKWFFLTPAYEHKELLTHCHKKTNEVLAANPNHISLDFIIQIKTDDHFIKERNILIDAGGYKIRPSIPKIKAKAIVDWKEANLEHFNVLTRKLKKIIKSEAAVTETAERMVRRYIVGQNILNSIRKQFSEHYESIIRIKEAKEEQISMLSAMGRGRELPGTVLKEITVDYIEALEKQLNKSLEHSTAENLSNEAIADWLIGCSLDF